MSNWVDERTISEEERVLAERVEETEFNSLKDREDYRIVSGIIGKIREMKSSTGLVRCILKMRIDHGRSSTCVGSIPFHESSSGLFLPTNQAYLGANVEFLYHLSHGPKKGIGYFRNKDTGLNFRTKYSP